MSAKLCRGHDRQSLNNNERSQLLQDICLLPFAAKVWHDVVLAELFVQQSLSRQGQWPEVYVQLLARRPENRKRSRPPAISYISLKKHNEHDDTSHISRGSCKVSRAHQIASSWSEMAGVLS